MAFRRQRLWCAPAAHPLLLRAIPVKGAPISLQCKLNEPWLSYLSDHQVDWHVAYSLNAEIPTNLDALYSHEIDALTQTS